MKLKNTYKVALILLLSLLLRDFSYAQDRYFLALDKPGIINRKRFYVDDLLALKSKSEQQWYAGELDLVKKDFLVIDNKLLMLNDISHLRIQRLEWLQARLKPLALGGIMFFAFFSVNSIANNDSPFLSRGEWLAPICLVSPLIVFQPFRKRTYRIGNQRILKTIEII